MDPYTLGGMIFSLIMVLIVGGFIVSFPIMRRLGALMEESIRERRAGRLEHTQLAQLQGQIDALTRTLESTERQLELLGERQDFTESLVDSVSRRALPRKDGEEPGAG
jgi:hypothetical protein